MGKGSTTRRTRVGRAAGVGVLALSLTGGITAFTASPASAATCTSYQLLMARGTGEPQGDEPLVLGPVASKTQAKVAGGSVYNVVYPASTDYVNGPNQGGADINKQLAAQVAACPSQKFVLGGYSEGAMAVGTALKSIPAGTQPKIAAIVLFGDPYYQSGKPWNAPTNPPGTYSGLAAALGGNSAYPTYSTRIQDYCATDDTVCGSGADWTGHFTYGNNADAAATFIAGKLAGTTTTPPVTTPPASPAPPVTTPPTTTPPTTGSGSDFWSIVLGWLGGLFPGL